MPSLNIIKVMSFTTYFNNGIKKYETGICHKYIDLNNKKLIRWITDYTNNTF
jgi:hypothetical protein